MISHYFLLFDLSLRGPWKEGYHGCPAELVPERKLGFFVQIKEGENFNRRNTIEYFED